MTRLLSLLDLNHDILLHISSLLEEKSAKSFALTATRVYLILKPRRIHNVCACMTQTEGSSVYQYLSRSSDLINHTCIHSLRTLQVKLSRGSHTEYLSSLEPPISTTLTDALSLRQLSLYPMESLLKGDPLLGGALTALRSLQRLELSWMGILSLRLLPMLSCAGSLVDLSLEIATDVGPFHLQDLVTALYPLKRLTTLKLCGHVFCQECVQNLISNRNRKCPACARAFGNGDFMGIVLT